MGEKRNSWRESGSDADCLDGRRKNIAYGFEPGAARRMNTENRFYEETAPTLRANMGDNQTAVVLIYDARGNGDGCVCVSYPYRRPSEPHHRLHRNRSGGEQ